MKRLILVFAALVAALTIPAAASANGGGGTPPPPPLICPGLSRLCPPPPAPAPTPPPVSPGSWGNADIDPVNVSCAAPNGSYQVTWVATITRLGKYDTPTFWSVGGQVASVAAPIWIVTSHTRQAVLFSSPPRIAVVAQIGMSRPVLAASAGVPGYCT